MRGAQSSSAAPSSAAHAAEPSPSLRPTVLAAHAAAIAAAAAAAAALRRRGQQKPGASTRTSPAWSVESQAGAVVPHRAVAPALRRSPGPAARAATAVRHAAATAVASVCPTAGSPPVRLSIFGSTGSIGTQTLDLVRRSPRRYVVHSLVAGSNTAELAQQIVEFRPREVIVGAASRRPLEAALRTRAQAELRRLERGGGDVLEATTYLRAVLAGGGPRIVDSSPAAHARLASSSSTDVVVAAIVGFAGVHSTLAGLRAGKRVVLANKESIVAAGDVIEKAMREPGAGELIPADSEHSAIFQCLEGLKNPTAELQRLILTASGGAFRDMSASQVASLSRAERRRKASTHPTWPDMGKKITVDSASLANKGLEVIEACRLFGLHPERILVAVHPQSLVHSGVETVDGSCLLQAGAADMRHALKFGLEYPQRRRDEQKEERSDSSSSWATRFFSDGKLEFAPADLAKYPMLALALRAARARGVIPAVFSAANEVAVDALLRNEIDFLDIPRVVERVMMMDAAESVIGESGQWARFDSATLEGVIAADSAARAAAKAACRSVAAAA